MQQSLNQSGLSLFAMPGSFCHDHGPHVMESSISGSTNSRESVQAVSDLCRDLGGLAWRPWQTRARSSAIGMPSLWILIAWPYLLNRCWGSTPDEERQWAS